MPPSDIDGDIKQLIRTSAAIEERTAQTARQLQDLSGKLEKDGAKWQETRDEVLVRVGEIKGTTRTATFIGSALWGLFMLGLGWLATRWSTFDDFRTDQRVLNAETKAKLEAIQNLPEVVQEMNDKLDSFSGTLHQVQGAVGQAGKNVTVKAVVPAPSHNTIVVEPASIVRGASSNPPGRVR